MDRIIVAMAILVNTTIIASAQPQAERKVAEVVEALKNAMINAEKNSLESLVSDKLSYGHSGGSVDDKKTFVEK